jgi:dTDP-4-amino-4,6-dideoxygalactose transaminase
VASGSRTRSAIPFFNYQGAFASRETQFLSIVKDVIRRGAFIQQRDLYEFEQSLAQYVGVKHALGVANATDGLTMALRAAGVVAGDEVIFPSHTMVATAAAITHAGAVPVPADCSDDHLIDPTAAALAITERTRAILPVHLNGRTCGMDAIVRLAEDNELLIVEDAAQALGSRFNGKSAGSFGAAGVFSFYPAKILGCLGDGGAVVTDDDDVARKLALLRDHGRNADGEVELWGYNSRLDNLQAALLKAQFDDYQQIIDRRRAIASEYHRLLHGVEQLRLPEPPSESGLHYDVFQNYEIEAENRDSLQAFLSANKVGTIVQWGGKAVHQFTKLGFDVVLPRTESLFEKCLLLPLNMIVSDDEVEFVSTCIREFYRQKELAGR